MFEYTEDLIIAMICDIVFPDDNNVRMCSETTRLKMKDNNLPNKEEFYKFIKYNKQVKQIDFDGVQNELNSKATYLFNLFRSRGKKRKVEMMNYCFMLIDPNHHYGMTYKKEMSEINSWTNRELEDKFYDNLYKTVGYELAKVMSGDSPSIIENLYNKYIVNEIE